MAIVAVATDFGGPEKLSLVEQGVPAPGTGEVTIAVRAASINPVDAKIVAGLFGRNPAALPLRLGSEVSGVVTAVGPDAAGPAGEIHVGDEVIAYQVTGGYASEVTTPAAGVVPKPASLGWEQAAGIYVVSATALHALAVTGVKDGETVLIHGVSGGVGLATAQLAIGRGARVIGTAAAGRHEALRRYGVEPVAYGPGLADRVRTLAPNGVDAAIDAVGTDEAVDVSVELVPDRDRIVTMAAFQRGAEAGIKRIGGAPGADRGEEVRSRALSEVLPLAAEGKYEVVVARTFPLTQAADALALVAGGHAGGKVILVP